MEIILTHEQSDFDALASVLGAYLLNPERIPILPRRLNRNVQAFVSLYQDELPFISSKSIPNEAISQVILVDTQSLITLKGMSKKTEVNILDHHPIRPDIPDSWEIKTIETGSCATYFVEKIMDVGLDINPIHATLLMLGIYEDTGSMTYAGTTPRDIRAAARLLENGANLKIGRKYLNPSLTPDQTIVFDDLLAAARIFTIHDQDIIISATMAKELNSEVSSIAHKLRDFLDPAAILLLVYTSEGIRLVGRSVTDHVDVSTIAAHFGGGGHKRAAAALIKFDSTNTTLEESSFLQQVREELTEILPKHVHPSLTVSQIMSKKPILLNPDTSAKEAFKLIQKYGYDGYPVVAGEDENLIGLLSRRAVDRSIAHKLNLSVHSLMEPGEIKVSPHDSVVYLQKVMTRSGWGQIPVIDPDSKKIIGIVTRTDLIKTLDGGPELVPGKQNLSEKLETALPNTRLALLKAISNEAHKQWLALYIVGGFVRDLILDRPSMDFDLVVEGDAIALGKSLVERFGGRIISHKRFGTAKWFTGEIRDSLAKNISDEETLNPEEIPETLDLISARTEFYDHPSALPKVEHSSIKLDLHRRDFSINTMALRLDSQHYGDLYDYWGGLKDLKHGYIRVLHSLSFVDDPTRMLRAVRFEQRFNFQIEKRTLDLIKEASKLLRQVSGDRLRHEFDLMLAEDQVFGDFLRLEELNILSAIHPALKWKNYSILVEKLLSDFPKNDEIWDLPKQFGAMSTQKAMVYIGWMIQLPENDFLSISDRLRLPNTIHLSVLEVRRLQTEVDQLLIASPGRIVNRLENLSIVILYITTKTYNHIGFSKLVHKYLQSWRYVKPGIDGHTLKNMKIKPGPIYRDILEDVRTAWLDGSIQTHQEEIKLVENLISKYTNKNEIRSK
ncbi:MAG: CBS domain-containing protein [Anaerolineaceae bacterium]|nr:CBS domain-containing protein [Anaerolineaceae bacterium]